MKLLSYKTAGKQSYGALKNDGIIDLKDRLGQPTLRAAIAAGLLDSIAGRVDGLKPDYAFSDIELMIPVPDAGKIICIGRNYRGHVAEGGQPLPKTPSTFIRVHSSFVAPGEAMMRPRLSDQFDYEGELALVIGRAGKHIRREHAFDYIAGYTCLHEGSIRDYQFGHALAVGKNFDKTGSIGPWLVTRDDIPDVSTLTLTTTLNGVQVQHTKTDDFIFDIPAILAYVSGFMELVPGDVIATGTPEGVGFARKPPLWLKPGDKVEVAITSIGVLRNSVVGE
ncbi:2-keto-4-pentenoate hydratase/2-oxohepta-3-ene-1,7-dioic acid hydratase in catechol pathway [Rhizobium sp. BK313]|uniref:fumarylacetoacetate hydrolase family protein n=1 Tax=Rhizobium sp. BK313 TaxID=2587081 RepID=UPI00105BC45B|nr:fumarylacetoacetate hydrolase family protein [Rhizobium sp. BK313]MBB3458711.1 2-keto-4-pentenoate hydratase/2-oxohepta-3-ene-1,7-dioic acid hydratase in catechol pathway [Rhizobium sp. BK313]